MMVHESMQAKFFHYWQAHPLHASLLLLVVLLLAPLPLGADNGPNRSPSRSTSNSMNNSPVPALVAELSPRSTESGFVDLVISKARGLSNLADAVSLLSALINQNIRAADRRSLYVERASIQELLGRYEEAATSWEAAIAALPGQGETAWLLSAAACKLATGDTDAAVALSKAAMLTTANPGLVARALLIEARALMLSGDFASSLARSREALAIRVSGFEAAALSLARDVSSGAEREGYDKQLREKYSGRPETQDTLASIYYSLVNFDPGQSVAVRIPSPAAGVVPGSTSTGAKQSEGKADALSGPVYYQLGAFRDEANAALLSTRLVRAGFKPETVKRESKTGVLSIVYLDAGLDPASLMIALKDAGFESWPLFAEP